MASASNVRPVMLSRDMAVRALRDSAFLDKLPEFRGLKIKHDLGLKAIPVKRGCCRKTRVESATLSDFLAVVRTLSPASAQALKDYFKVPALLMTCRNPHTGAFENKVM